MAAVRLLLETLGWVAVTLGVGWLSHWLAPRRAESCESRTTGGWQGRSWFYGDIRGGGVGGGGGGDAADRRHGWQWVALVVVTAVFTFDAQGGQRGEGSGGLVSGGDGGLCDRGLWRGVVRSPDGAMADCAAVGHPVGRLRQWRHGRSTPVGWLPPPRPSLTVWGCPLLGMSLGLSPLPLGGSW